MTVIQGFIVQPHITVLGRGAVFGTVPLAVRFWAKVLLGDGCWEWASGLSHGRAIIGVNGRPKAAAIVSWNLANGEVPKGLKVCHECDNPKCVRPSHLFLGTQWDNIQDARRKGRLRQNRTYRPENSPTAQLTWDKVREIRANNSDTLATLAKRYGVCIAAVSNVKNGKTWIESKYQEAA